MINILFQQYVIKYGILKMKDSRNSMEILMIIKKHFQKKS